MAEDAVRSKKTFTYDEAAHLLPEVRRITDAAYRQVESISAGPALNVSVFSETFAPRSRAKIP